MLYWILTTSIKVIATHLLIASSLSIPQTITAIVIINSFI